MATEVFRCFIFNIQQLPRFLMLQIVVPGRVYSLMAGNDKDLQYWLDGLANILPASIPVEGTEVPRPGCTH